MTKLDKLQNYLPSIYNEIAEIQEILKAESTKLEELDIDALAVINSVFIDNAEDVGLKRYEKIFNIVVPIGSTIPERRSILKSTLRGIDKLSATVVKNISLAYQNGEVDVSFVPSNIIVKFTSVLGIPTNLIKLQEYLNGRKPSHLGILYLFSYLLIQDIDQVMTLDELETMTLDKFAF